MHYLFVAGLRHPSAPSQLLLDLYHKLYVPYATQGLRGVGHGQQSSRRPHHFIFGEPPDLLADLALLTAVSLGSAPVCARLLVRAGLWHCPTNSQLLVGLFHSNLDATGLCGAVTDQQIWR